MKLSGYYNKIARAYDALMVDYAIATEKPPMAFTYQPRRQNHIIPKAQPQARPPVIPKQYEPITPSIGENNKEQLVLLAAFEATYQDSKTPLSPDMVPLILDTGASISISPYKTDFITPIKPVQQVKIKGIASGLNVEGIGDISYTFFNDNGEKQKLLLQGCLYVPQCSVRLICPRQIGAETGHPEDGFNAKHANPILTVHG